VVGGGSISVKNESAISREVNKMLFSKEGSIN
jgi:hypothetical protein